MNDLPKELWGLIGTAIGVVGTVLAGLLKMRREDADAARALRNELRIDNTELKQRVAALEKAVQSLLDERLILKRALDKRDHEIEVLKARLAAVEEVSEPMEVL